MTKQKTVNQILRKRLKARDRVGQETYGKPLLPWDGRNTAEDALEEALDLAVYLQKMIEERKQVAEAIKSVTDIMFVNQSHFRGLGGDFFVKTNYLMRIAEALTRDIPRVGVKTAMERLEDMDNG